MSNETNHHGAETMTKTESLKVEAGQTYRVTYGHGHQLFHITYVSKQGKPFGLRLIGRSEGRGRWAPSEMKIDDPRLGCLASIPADAPKIVLPAKADTKALAVEAKRLQKILDDVVALSPGPLSYETPEGISERTWRAAYYESHSLDGKRNREERIAAGRALDKLAIAKTWNKILPR